uniref:MAGUK p55 subfamily member 5 n=1 Tax=Cacopsylla melanoneura TaxID=428564 RepID=A0A8D8U240_9HEMI
MFKMLSSSLSSNRPGNGWNVFQPLTESRPLTCHSCHFRSIRRQSGSSIVSDATDFEIVKKKYLDEEEDDEYSNIMRMISGMDSGPHREMAVDVPETFIARTKTPPRYPPPRTAERIQNGIPMTVIQPKPAPPPRGDHLKNLDKPTPPRSKAPLQPPTSPPPQIPARINNNHTPTPTETPTKEQLNSIRKYQEVIRKQKEKDDKIAEQNEFLNRSLRGSRKLQVLENKSGVVNDAFSVEDESEAGKFNQDEEMEMVDEEIEDEEPDTLHKVYNYGETVSAIKRLMVNLKKLNQVEGVTIPESKLQLVQNLILSPEFGRALFLHNAVQQSYSFKSETAIPLTSHLQSLAKESIKVLESCSLPEASECINILEDMDQTLNAHDAIVLNLTPNIMNPVEQPVVSYNEGVEGNIKIIKFPESNELLGATIRNEGDAVIVGRVVKGGLADRTGLLHEGDEILEINGIEIRGKTIHNVCDILVGLTGQEMTMLVFPNPETNNKRTNSRENLMHVIAHFDYDPEDDMYIPCKELGMSFQKGDILHVISQDDPNWWQAYREGEEDHTLAGLIPSRSFQYQREQLKRSINSDITDKDKSTSPIHFFSSNFLCSKSKQKLKKKKSASNAPFGDGNYPLYSSSATDFDVDEILTYEEVSLYYPRSNEKRPIVLIGPPNIGRHELRQRLMEDSDRFAAAIPHTSRPMKEGEVDGQDYHFITRAQFELDILARKFIEHGEYEKSYYGTSLDAIRTVVNAGKICVLNLHPQSLKILRSSDLKPFVIFVAPPPFELLKQKRIRRGDNFKDEDLKDTIEKAREMEEKYGKYFDMVIINKDNESSYQEIIDQVNYLEREPQWVPSTWVKTA